jgi:hypothetical protein
MNIRHENKNAPKSVVPNAVQVKPGVYVVNSSTSVFITKKK